MFSRLFLLLAPFLLLDRCATPSILATQSIQRGDQLNNENRYEESARYYEDYLRISASMGSFRNPEMEAEVHRKLAHAYLTQGMFKKAESNLYSALALDSLNGFDTIEDHQLIGNLYAVQKDYVKAKAHLSYCIERMLRLENSLKATNQEKIAKTFLLTSQVDMAIGNLREATHLAQLANARYFKLQNEGGCAEAELILAINERDRGNIESSIKHLERSLNLEKKIGGNLSRHLQLEGDLKFVLGDPEEAIRLKGEALEEAKKTQIEPMIAWANRRMGDAYLKLGDQKKSDYFFNEAFTIQSKFEGSANHLDFSGNQSLQGSKIGLGILLIEQAELEASRKRYDSAIRLAKQAKEVFDLVENNEGMARASLNLVECYLQTNQIVSAKQSLRVASELTTTSATRWKIHFFEGRVFEYESKTDSAIESYRKSEMEIRKLRSNINLGEFRSLFAIEKFVVYDHLIVLLVKKGLAENSATLLQEAFSYNEQARARTFFESLGNNRIGAKAGADSSVVQHEQDLRSKINRLHQSIDQVEYTNPEGYQRLREELERTQVEYDILLQKIRLDNKDVYSLIDTSVPNINVLKKDILDDTKVVEFWVSDLDHLIVWVIDKDDITTRLISTNTSQLNRKLKGIRSSIAFKDVQSSTSLLKELYLLLFAPIQTKLEVSKSLVVIPHRQLHFIPFPALISGESFLVEKFNISTSPSLSILVHQRKLDDLFTESFLGMALARLKLGNLSSLPGTESEIKAIQKLYRDGKFKTNEEFTETFFKDNARQFDLIHFATHGVLNPDYPLYSYLAMNSTETDDGRLTVKEVFDLSLKSRGVVLSACETGIGELSNADELVGLSRAFLYAGAHCIVVSLWKVDDLSTSWLMTRFYGYLKNGSSFAEALSSSQRDLLRGKFDEKSDRDSKRISKNADEKNVPDITMEQWRAPYYWAAFGVIGRSN